MFHLRTQARYGILLVGVVFFIFYLVYGNPLGRKKRVANIVVDESRRYWEDKDVFPQYTEVSNASCSMATCFDFSKCAGRRLKACMTLVVLEVYVYPDEPQLDGEPFVRSEAYSKILDVIRGSAYYTKHPSEACLFVLSVDTTDRDKISENFVQNMPGLVSSLPENLWNEGRNHIIFNIYHGTYPNYAAEHLGFDTGKAIIARASAGAHSFRHNFDISLPLFHKEHPIRSSIENRTLNEKDKYLISFKGKRYVYGIGSETRDSLHHLHASRTPMLTTCRHNNDWQAHQDERCEADNTEYDKWDYDSLMANSTFCLCPRGRRLGTFRFLESLRSGCIPMVLSDDWRLPFDEIIDWTVAAIRVPEKDVLFANDIAASFPFHRRMDVKKQGRMLYNRYFASVEKITLATLELVWRRVLQEYGRQLPLTDSLLPFEPKWNADETRPLAAVISTSNRLSSRLQHLLQHIRHLRGLKECKNGTRQGRRMKRRRRRMPFHDVVIVLWPKTRGAFPVGADAGLPKNVNLHIIETASQTELPLVNVMERIEDRRFEGTAVLFINERATVNGAQLSHLLEVFEEQPNSIVTTHVVDYDKGKAQMARGSANVALLHTAIVHSGYLSLLSSSLPQPIIDSCPTASLSIVVSAHSQTPPTFVDIDQSVQEGAWPLSELARCLDLIGKRYPLGIPLVRGA